MTSVSAMVSGDGKTLSWQSPSELLSWADGVDGWRYQVSNDPIPSEPERPWYLRWVLSDPDLGGVVDVSTSRHKTLLAAMVVAGKHHADQLAANARAAAATEQTLKYRLLLAARGNPDRDQDPERPPFGVPADHLVPCDSLDHARRLAAAYIDQYRLGGGNWVGGDVFTPAGRHVSGIAYNGRLTEAGPLVASGRFKFLANEDDVLADRMKRLDAVTGDWTDDGWRAVLAARPELADRLRSTLQELLDAEAEPTASMSP